MTFYDQATKDRLWQIINSKNWLDPVFDLEKAFVASIFAEIAYEHITKAEMIHKGRMIVVPCLRYYDLVSSKQRGDVLGLVQSLGDLPEPLVIETDFAVAVVVKVNELIFVGIRGTIATYTTDWMIDLNVKKGVPCSGDVCIHKGFLKAAENLYNPLSSAIQRIGGNLVYLSGHSMGGAIAAVLHAIWDGGFLSKFLGIQLKAGIPLSHSAYAFGMPRYTNSAGIKRLRTPFHVAHQRDFVARLPVKWLGYEDCPNLHLLNGQRMQLDRSNPIMAKIAPYHLMECYQKWL